MRVLADIGGSLPDPDHSMGSEILQPDSRNETSTSTPEVEFALVLSRMIESVQNDPEHLRATICELARHKMKEQSISLRFAERRQLSKALETAIQGRYEFRSEDPDGALTPGRYALVLKGQAYDFSVGGSISDPETMPRATGRHERSVLISKPEAVAE